VRVDAHINPAAHAIIAEELSTFILEQRSH
jgi:hypothetical protein